jgi:hypothetical protein
MLMIKKVCRHVRFKGAKNVQKKFFVLKQWKTVDIGVFDPVDAEN